MMDINELIEESNRKPVIPKPRPDWIKPKT